MSTAKKILLIHCARYNNITPIITMGLWGLADFIAQHGFYPSIIHTKVEEEKHGDFKIERYIDNDVLAVGFSAHWFPMLKESIDLAREVKSISNDVKTIMGGYSASFFAEKLMKEYPFIDYIIKGDGEKPLLELLRVISSRKENGYRMVPNLVWRNGAKCISNEISYVSTNDDLKNIDFACMDKYTYDFDYAKNSSAFNIKIGQICDFAITDYKPEKTFFLLTGKGCTTNCAFCGGGKKAQEILNNRNECLFLDDEVIIQTMKKAIDMGYRNFYVCFDPYPDNPRYLKWLRKVQEQCLDIDLCFGFWKIPTYEQINEFKKTTGNLLFEISPETISEPVREKVKGFSFSNNELYNTIRKLYDEKIYTNIYFSYPLPFETMEDVINTRVACWEINTSYPHYIEAFYLRLSTDPASPIYCEPEKYDCKLIVKDLEEHMEKSCKHVDGNIMIHAVNSVSDDKIYRKLFLDDGIKRIFKYYIKLLAKAFNSVNEFIYFLDEFYEYTNILENQYSDQYKDSLGFIRGLKEFVHCSEYKNVSYISDLVDFVYAFHDVSLGHEIISVKQKVKGSNEDNNGIPIMNQYYKIVELNYDIYRAYRKIVDEKTFSTPVYIENGIRYLIVLNKGIPDVYEINESFCMLLKQIACNEKLTCLDIANEIASNYTDDIDKKALIINDMLAAIRELERGGLIVLQ